MLCGGVLPGTDAAVLETSALDQGGGIGFLIEVVCVSTSRHTPRREEDDFYRSVGRGPITVARPAGDRKEPTSPKPQQPSPAKPRRSLSA
jgi:hypothetical protein